MKACKRKPWVPPQGLSGHADFTGGTITTVGGVGPPPPTTFVTFNGTRAFGAGSDSDTELSVGPYIKLAYDLVDFDSNTLHLSAYGQYTFTTAFDSGNDPVSIRNVATTYQGVGIPGPGAAVIFQPGPGPRGGAAPTQTITRRAAFVGSGVNIDMHTFTLGLELTKDSHRQGASCALNGTDAEFVLHRTCINSGRTYNGGSAGPSNT